MMPLWICYSGHWTGTNHIHTFSILMKLNIRHALPCAENASMPDLLWMCFCRARVSSFLWGECPSCHTDQRLSLDISINCSMPHHRQCLCMRVSLWVRRECVRACMRGEVGALCVHIQPPLHHQRLYYALLLAWPTCSPKHGAVWYSTHVFPSPLHSSVMSAGPLHLLWLLN